MVLNIVDSRFITDFLYIFELQLCVVMIKTYEVHDTVSEDDDEMVDFDPEVVENLNFWQRCFVPKYPNDPGKSDKEDCSDTHIPIETQHARIKEEELEETRARFNSEDVTVQTNLTTPPGTPDVKYSCSVSSTSCKKGIIPRNASYSSDLEIPSFRNNITAIDEEKAEEIDRVLDDEKEKG